MKISIAFDVQSYEKNKIFAMISGKKQQGKRFFCIFAAEKDRRGRMLTEQPRKG